MPETLDVDFGIFEFLKDKTPEELAALREVSAIDAADLWRTQMKHVVSHRASVRGQILNP